MSELTEIRSIINDTPARSAWDRGVKLYASDLLDELEESISSGYFDADDLAAPALLRRQLLNGASSWSEYSWGGCSLIYDGDIAARLCTKSELVKTHNGQRNPNSREQWLDVQARALRSAANLIVNAAKKCHLMGAVL